LIGLKQNEPAVAFTNLKKMVILFAMFGNNEYVDTLLLHLHLFEYQVSIDHPHVDLFIKNLYNLVGEDIELGNRALSHCSVRNARRSGLELLDKAYRLLRFLRTAGVQFGEDMYEYREITKGTRRYDADDDETLDTIRTFMTDLVTSFEEGKFTHYAIPHKFQSRSKRIRTEKKGEKKAILVLQSGNVEKKVIAEGTRTLMAVPYLGAYEWLHFVEQTLATTFKKNANMFDKLQRSTLEYLEAECPKYTSQYLKDYLRENPAPRVRKRKGPRLFSHSVDEEDEKEVET
jgi:hypothetical protein